MSEDQCKKLEALRDDLDRLIYWNEPGYDGPSTEEIARKMRELVQILIGARDDE